MTKPELLDKLRDHRGDLAGKISGDPGGYGRKISVNTARAWCHDLIDEIMGDVDALEDGAPSSRNG